MTERITDERLARMIEMASADTEIIGDRRNRRGSQYRYTVDVEATLRELAELREQVRWRPMEEAPRDGTHVLAFFPDWQCTGEPRVMAVKWTGPPDSKHNWWSIPGHGGLSPTHWREIGPLPGGNA